MTAPSNGTVPKRAFSIPEAAEAYAVSPKILRAAIKSGALKAKHQSRSDDGKRGVGKFIISAAALDEWFDGLVDVA